MGMKKQSITPFKQADFETWLDKALKPIIGDGNTAHLRGAGKPLNFEAFDDPNTPAEWRMAFKLMRDNGVAPEWVQLAAELRDLREKIRRVLAHFARDYQQRQRLARARASSILERDAEARWRSAQERARALIDEYNKKVLTYNLVVPPAIGQSELLQVDAEIKRALQGVEALEVGA